MILQRKVRPSVAVLLRVTERMISFFLKTAAIFRGGFLVYYSRTFGAAQANPDRQDKTLQGNRPEKCESFMYGDTDAEACAHTRAPLSVFRTRQSHSLSGNRREAVSFF